MVIFLIYSFKTQKHETGIFKNSGKKFISAAFISASVLMTSHSAQAGTGDNITPSAIQYTGSTYDGIMLKMRINNETGANFTLTVKDDNGEVLFTEVYNDKSFDKQFKLLKGDQYSSYYYFTVSSLNKQLEQKYVVNTSTRPVKDVAISKL